jgi:cystathionine beta-synthase
MGEYGFATTEGSIVADVVRGDFAVIAPAMSVAEAMAVLRDAGRSVAPVVKGQPPYSAAEVVGSIDLDALAGLVDRDPNLGEANVTAVMEARLPRVGIGESLLRAAEVLATASAAVVHDGGRPVGVITRDDLVGVADEH